MDTAEKVVNTHIDNVSSELPAGHSVPLQSGRICCISLCSLESTTEILRPQEQAVDSDRNNGLIMMSSVQTLERMPSPFMTITEANSACSCLKIMMICRRCYQLCWQCLPQAAGYQGAEGTTGTASPTLCLAMMRIWQLQSAGERLWIEKSITWVSKRD